MIACDRGDVVLVEFVFADESGKKRRPAVVVSSSPFQRARRDMIVAAVTSNVSRQLFGDHMIADWRGAGLLFPSMVTGVLRTVGQSMVERKLGSLLRGDLDRVDWELRRSLDLGLSRVR